MAVSRKEVGVRRTSAGGVSVDGYAILFEEVPPPTRFEYRVVNVADRAVSEKLKRLVSEGYRAVAIVAPAILVMERRSEDVSKIDEYRILQSVDAQHVAPNLRKPPSMDFESRALGHRPQACERSCCWSMLPTTNARLNTKFSQVMADESWRNN